MKINKSKVLYLKCWFLYLLIFSIIIIFISNPVYATSYTKPRIIVTTDITNEPDDQQSLIRLLVYSNNYSIEGIIGSTGIWKLCDPATDVIHECINAYSAVRDNLILHDADFPTGRYLHSITKTGNRGYGMSAVGERGSEGADLIISAVDKQDTRPVWLLTWGGANTIAQALWIVKETRNEKDIEDFIRKIRVYDLAGQDDAGAWLAKTFPKLFIIRNVLSYKGMSFRFSSDAWNHTRGGNESVVTKEWVKNNIQTNHGNLGALYPDAWHLWEGDTPTFFYLMPNGLNDPEQQWQGSWGGRFTREKQKNVNVVVQEYAGAPCIKGCWVNENPYLDYWLYADAADKWEYEGKIYNNRWASIFRWRTDFQNDFAARMDWCVKDFKNANHNPEVIVNGDDSKSVLYKKISPGQSFQLDASKSNDPDNDKLNYTWWIYKEAGTYLNDVFMENNNSPQVSIQIPKDASGKTIHVLLTIRDDGNPSLTRYRRVVFLVKKK
jgi:hypothetical protein